MDSVQVHSRRLQTTAQDMSHKNIGHTNSHFTYARTLQCSTGYFFAFNSILARMLRIQFKRNDLDVSHNPTNNSVKADMSSSSTTDVLVFVSSGDVGVDDGNTDRVRGSIVLAIAHNRPASAPTRKMHDRGSLSLSFVIMVPLGLILILMLSSKASFVANRTPVG